MPLNAHEAFQAGKLQDAIAGATDAVRSAPTDTGKRGFLAELLCFAGEWERADKQLDALGHQDPETMLGISLFRHLIRAEQARQQFYTEGRAPEFLAQPTPAMRLALEANILLREGKSTEAAKVLAEVEEKRPKPGGTCNGKPFEDLRDLDDASAGVFEVLTSNGKFYWVALELVESIEFRKPARPRDLLWRRAHMIVRDGPDGEVYLPSLYAGSQSDPDDQIRLARATNWKGGNDGAPVRGVGQRTFLVGEDALSILELEEVEFKQG